MRVILNPGHGGMLFGEYMTAGKRSPSVPPGIYEGEYNRRLCQKIKVKLREQCIYSEILVPGPVQVSLKDRIKTVRKIYKVYKDVILLDVHCNAHGNGADWTKANGHIVFYKRNRLSELLAICLRDTWKESPNQVRSRGIKPNPSMKLKNRGLYYMLRASPCPTILVETAFMTHRQDVYEITEHIDHVATAYVDGLVRYRARTAYVDGSVRYRARTAYVDGSVRYRARTA